MYCPTCGKELYDNGEERFNCPFCGAEVVGSGPETEEEREETLEERCKRLERELARQKLKAEIEEQSAAEHFCSVAAIRSPCYLGNRPAMRWSAATLNLRKGIWPVRRSRSMLAAYCSSSPLS